MLEATNVHCPECDGGLSRREFIRDLGGEMIVAAGVTGLLTSNANAMVRPRRVRPAEELVRELYATFTPEQKKSLVLPWNHGAPNGKGMPTRLGMYNSPILKKLIGEEYRPAQQELVERILKAISADEDGYRRISRNGTFDGSGSLQGCGALLFGEPNESGDWSWVFSGHHLTVRCDGKPKDGIGFGGPMYYGHSPNGYSDRNVFFYQTKSVMGLFDALNETQRKQAVLDGTPGEQAPSVKLRGPDQPKPGLAFAELDKSQRQLVEKVMRDLLSPYRKEDVDEVLEIIKATGGMDKTHLAFYRSDEADAKERWHFWRLEGPGFVWNFRVLPHVHTYVNIGGKV